MYLRRGESHEAYIKRQHDQPWNSADTRRNWYDATIYPSFYPTLPPHTFNSLSGGTLIGPGWRTYDTEAEATEAVLRAMALNPPLHL